MAKPQILRGPEFIHSIEESTIGQFFFNSAQKNADRLCQVNATTGETETYASVSFRSTRVAIALQNRGVTSEDVITICYTNTMDNTVALIAASYLGAKVNNLQLLSAGYITHVLSLVTPKIIFVDEASISVIEESLVDARFQTEIILFGTSNKYSSFTDLTKVQEEEENFRPVYVDIEDTAIMIFSSGSTGLPKAICHSHRSFLFVALTAFESMFPEAMFHFLSIYAASTLAVFGCVYKSGTYRVFCNEPAPENVFGYIEKYKVAFAFVTPFFTYNLTRVPNVKSYDTSSLKSVMISGGNLPPSQIQRMNDTFPTASTILVYGLSETGLVTIVRSKDEQNIRNQKICSSGKVVSGMQLKVVDMTTEELMLPPDQEGEIRVKSPSTMMGYYKEDFSHVFDKDGFLKTGDEGFYDEHGCIYLVERLKEVIKYQSWPIVPSIIEGVLQDHPAVAEVVVFAVPVSEEDGEAPAACIVVKKNCSLNEEEIDDYLKNKVLDRERLRGGVTFVDNLPRTASGKVERREVKAWVYNQRSNAK